METQHSEVRRSEPIAIIGLGCRFPGASSPAAYWNLLREGRSAIVDVPTERWNIDEFYDPDLSSFGSMNTRWGGFLDSVDTFDPNFFGISPREAASIDPQQRLVVEVAWEALERAGQPLERLAGSRTGVFVGSFMWDYFLLYKDAPPRGGTGVANSLIANRLSFLLDLRGPSMVVDSACSSSLMAVDLACQSLRSGRTRMAIAGGVNLILAPTWTVAFSQAGMMAPDGRCKTFDASANGYVRGEGCGMVVLKRLSDALADGDEVLAVIREVISNHNGRIGTITAPSREAQEELVREALALAGVAPSDVDYVETHGTGTPLGDLAEVSALAGVMGEGRPAGARCLIGSVKTNIGHLEAAAGIAGLIKLVLCLQHGQVPPNLNLKDFRSELHLEEGPLEVVQSLRAWPSKGGRRIGAVSSFGFGGANAHAIVEEAPPRPAQRPEVERPLHLLTLSAKTEPALEQLIASYRDALAAEPPVADFCYSSNTGRSAFPYRVAVVGDTPATLRARLEGLKVGEAAGRDVGRAPATPPQVAVVFSGQGSQYVGMARGLYQTQPAFRQALDRCAELLRPHLEHPLLEVIYGDGEPSKQLGDTRYTQTALFAVEYALFEMWSSWGLRPAAVFGHSLGEYVAACVSGVLTLEEGISLVAQRASLVGALPRNGMMAMVSASRDEVSEVLRRCGGVVCIAAANGPNNTVISGMRADVEAALDAFEEDMVFVRPLDVSHASHSPLMEPVLKPYEECLRRVRFAAPRIPIIANLTGEKAEAYTPEYWLQHLIKPVLFEASIRSLVGQGIGLFLELGPSNTVVEMGRRCLPQEPVTWLSTLKRDENDWEVLLQSAASLFKLGVGIDWAAFDRPYGRRRVPVPHHPLKKQRCWLEPDELRTFQGRT